MPTRCTAPARYSGIRNSWPVPTHAGRPDSSDHTSEPAPARLPRPSQSPESRKPECASEPPSGLAGTTRLPLGIGGEIQIGLPKSVPARGRRLAPLVGLETAVHGPRAANRPLVGGGE